MKNMMILLLAGVTFTSVSYAMTNTQLAEEQLKAKTGRYSPSEEARRQSASAKQDGHGDACKKQTCCRRQHSSNCD